ncbi:MAG: DNA polymerase III subunit alpha [Treponema sp.]|nr:DNA polymerase III subunit alpha [Treponema sp.]MCL2271449.1 DNA polymerase III subunit alpha [Treponema sp.]
MNIRLGLISAYSFLYGVHKPQALLDKALSLGVKTVSICDLNNLYGLHSFIEEAKERNIRPVIGAALTVNQISCSNPQLRIPRYIFCFAENRAGFSRLCEILSIRNRDSKMFDPFLHLRENSCGLVLASSDADILRNLAGNVKRLYASVTPDDLGGVAACRQLNLPSAFLDTSLFLGGSDYPVHKVLRAIGLNKTVGSLASCDTAAQNRGILKTSAQLEGFLGSWPAAAKGTAEIAEICSFNKIFDSFIFPSYGENPSAELRRRVYSGAAVRYGELGDMETDRIEYELDVIEKTGFAPYFLRIDDIVKMARDGRTCGRGSGAASIVSYSLGITNVDPIAHNLYFERFLSPARPDPPDIDIDFAWDERDELIQKVIKTFGEDNCARVANHNFFRPRSALRETAKAYGFSDAAITQLERKIFNLREKEENIDPLWTEIYGIAQRIEGLPRGLSMHCGGIVITPKNINCYAPIEKSLEGYPLLAWEKEGAEAAGFVKIDLLGNRSLAVIRDAAGNLEELGIDKGELNSRLNRAVHDKATIEALSKGDSIGVFYIESPAMRQLQKKTGAGDFDHIVIHSSIIRPAANKFINEYVKRLRTGKWDPLHPRLKKILDESYGILCYQEDVSKTAIALANFSDVDADNLRKIIAKKAGAAKLAVYKKQFFEGCRENKVEEKTINEIWAMMLSFDGYSFCKPHSASYAMVSFQSAYLRVHYPAEFIAAVLSNQGGFYRPHAYISEARRMRLFVTGPDVNDSRWRYYGITNTECGIKNEKIEKSGIEKKNSKINEIYKGTVVIGFMAVKGLSASAAAAIIKERERGGNFLSLENFSRRIKLDRDDIVALCPAGVFDSVAGGIPRPVQARFLLGAREAKNGDSADGELFSDVSRNSKNIISPLKNIPHMSSRNSHSVLQEEYDSLGFLRSAHPLILWKEAVISVKNRVKASHIAEYEGRNVKMIGWPVTQKDVWTKDGLTMCFLSLEDETAIYETVVFPEVYDRYSKLLFDQKPLLVFGHVTNDLGAISVEIHRLEVLCDQRETAEISVPTYGRSL